MSLITVLYIVSAPSTIYKIMNIPKLPNHTLIMRVPNATK